MSRPTSSDSGAGGATRQFIDREERVHFTLPVRFGIGNADRESVAANISEGGLHIQTNDILRAGSRIDIEIDFPGRTVSQRGEVMWAIQVPERDRDSMIYGMGIRFVRVEPDWSRFFLQWKKGVNTAHVQP